MFPSCSSYFCIVFMCLQTTAFAQYAYKSIDSAIRCFCRTTCCVLGTVYVVFFARRGKHGPNNQYHFVGLYSSVISTRILCLFDKLHVSGENRICRSSATRGRILLGYSLYSGYSTRVIFSTAPWSDRCKNNQYRCSGFHVVRTQSMCVMDGLDVWAV